MKYPDMKDVRILRYPDPRLREHAARVREINSFLKEVSERMGELMREEKGIGLAATQVGCPFRLLVIAPPQEPANVASFINPVIIARSGKRFEEEGCLSVPGVFARVRRAEKVTVRATLPSGETVEIQSEGLVARAWQHEIDHLEGTLFVDRLSPSAKILVASQLQDMEARYQGEKH